MLTDVSRSRLLARHIPPQPLPRRHIAEVRPLAGTGRGHGGWNGGRAPDEGGPGVQAVREEASRVQVLVLEHQGDSRRIRVQLVPDVRPACLLAGPGRVLADSLCVDE